MGEVGYEVRGGVHHATLNLDLEYGDHQRVVRFSCASEEFKLVDRAMHAKLDRLEKTSAYGIDALRDLWTAQTKG